jgi:hypothetical protein
MALWGNVDDAANSTIFAASQVNKTANTTNRALLFSNTTADAFITNATIGQFGFDTTEQQVSSGGPSHSGWVLRTEGSGGRAGRVFYETLVAMGSMSGDAEDVVGKDYRIVITTNPDGATANATDNDIMTFSANGYTIPSGGTISYSWQYSIDDGDTWTNANGQTGFNNALTSTLSVTANAFSGGDFVSVRAVLSNTAATSATTTTAVLEVID